MPRREATLRGATAATAAVALALAAGCGGGSRQDAGERHATYRVEVPSATFPAYQGLAQHAELRIVVRNRDSRPIPNVAATIESDASGTTVEAFGRHSDAANLASSSRPVWIVDDGPGSGDSAYANTWALGRLAPGATKTFVWHVSAVEPGRYTVRYRLSGSVTGSSRLQLAGGRTPQGAFAVDISRKAARTVVRADGTIVRVPG